MPLTFRPAEPADHGKIEPMVIDSFEPITWIRKLMDRSGPMNSQDWRDIWHKRIERILASQIILIGESGGELAAMSSGTIDPGPALAYIELLAVNRRLLHRGYGREMLCAMMSHLRGLGAQYVYLDCLVDNDIANSLYRAEGFEPVAQQYRYFRKLEPES